MSFHKGNVDELIPNYPSFSASDWKECETSGHFGYIFFEWYRWVGNLAMVVAYIDKGSPDFKVIPKRDYHLLSGLLARCARLMLSIIALTHNREFGETASIIHRSLMESAVKVMWLGNADTTGRSLQLVANGLKPEIEFEAQILANIDANGGTASQLEERMLGSIDRHFEAAELTRGDVADAKRTPDLASMFESIGRDRLQYVVLQRLGSHAVHGNWPSLLIDYLEDDGTGAFRPRGDPVPMHSNLYVSGSRIVLEAIDGFCRACLVEQSSDSFLELAREADSKILEDYKMAIQLGL